MRSIRRSSPPDPVAVTSGSFGSPRPPDPITRAEPGPDPARSRDGSNGRGRSYREDLTDPGVVHIVRVDVEDSATVLACHDVFVAAHAADDPEGFTLSARVFGGWLAVGWYGQPAVIWAARDQASAVTGWYRLEMPYGANTDRAYLTLVVHPARRRRGVGRTLLRHALAQAASNRRSLVGSDVLDGSAGESFARWAGARPALTHIRRVQDLASVDADALARAREAAGRAAAGYSVVSWAGPVPEEFLHGVAAVFAALNDAPHPEGRQPWVWDAQRVREAHNEVLPRLGGLRPYSVAAVKGEGATRDIAALNQVWVDPALPDQGMHFITAVRREYRGHSLALLTKIAMLDLLASAVPQLKRLETWNAESNTQMIAVNEALGYRVFGPPSRRWQLEVASG
jgi:GNAT superfamily N-acetyltransferase/RimJ/RimL family protein N-acetyltransferase